MSEKPKFHSRPTAWVVAPIGEPIYSERATTVEINDEAAGEFIVIRQDTMEIRIDPDEWREIMGAVDAAIDEIDNANLDKAALEDKG